MVRSSESRYSGACASSSSARVAGRAATRTQRGGRPAAASAASIAASALGTLRMLARSAMRAEALVGDKAGHGRCTRGNIAYAAVSPCGPASPPPSPLPSPTSGWRRAWSTATGWDTSRRRSTGALYPGHLGYLPLLTALARLTGATRPVALVWPARVVSAAAAAFAAYALGSIARRRHGSDGAAWAAMLGLAASWGALSAGSDVESYAPALAALVGALWCADRQRPVAAAVLCATATLMHVENLLLVPVCVLVLDGRRARLVVVVVAGLAIAAAYAARARHARRRLARRSVARPPLSVAPLDRRSSPSTAPARRSSARPTPTRRRGRACSAASRSAPPPPSRSPPACAGRCHAPRCSPGSSPTRSSVSPSSPATPSAGLPLAAGLARRRRAPAPRARRRRGAVRRQPRRLAAGGARRHLAHARRGRGAPPPPRRRRRRPRPRLGRVHRLLRRLRRRHRCRSSTGPAPWRRGAARASSPSAPAHHDLYLARFADDGDPMGWKELRQFGIDRANARALLPPGRFVPVGDGLSAGNLSAPLSR